MKNLIILVIFLILIALLCYSNKEKFSGLNTLFYPDPDIKNQENWIKEHVNDTSTKKEILYKFLSLLEKQINNIIFSSDFSIVIQTHNNKIFEEKVPYIINFFKNKLIEIKDNTSNNKEYEIFTYSLYSELMQILINYLTCNHDILINNTSSNVSCNKYIEQNIKELHFDNSKLKEYKLGSDIHLIHKYFINKDIVSLINIFKKKLFKYYIYDNDEYKSQTILPCIIYNKKLCPNNEEKSKCELVNNSNCVPKSNSNKNINNNPIKDCNSISLYGKELCNRTINKESKDCIWNEKTQTCLNSIEESNPIKCEDLKGHNLKENCYNLTDTNNTKMCDYLSKVKNNKTHEFCFDKIKKNKMTCLNLSGIYDKNNINDAKELKKHNCSTETIRDIDYHYDNTLISKDRLYNLDCGTFDNSNYLIDKNNINFVKKDINTKYLGNNIELQKKLCENNKNTNNISRCSFISNKNYNNKTITKCMPNNILLSSNYINNKNTCNMLKYDYIGDDKNKKCLNIASKCNDIKHKSLCDLRDNECIWIKGSNNDLDRGYCINQDFSELDNLMDNYHNDEISKIAKFNNLSDELLKININEHIINNLNKKFKKLNKFNT